LYYYLRVVEQTKDKVNKDSYELLPKATPNDLIRTALSARDRAVLAHFTGNATRWTQLKARMDADILTCIQAVRPLRQSLTKQDMLTATHDAVFKPGMGNDVTVGNRYQNETSTSYGNAIGVDAPDEEAEPLRHQAWSQLTDAQRFAYIPDTPSGKPLGVL